MWNFNCVCVAGGEGGAVLVPLTPALFKGQLYLKTRAITFAFCFKILQEIKD